MRCYPLSPYLEYIKKAFTFKVFCGFHFLLTGWARIILQNSYSEHMSELVNYSQFECPQYLCISFCFSIAFQYNKNHHVGCEQLLMGSLFPWSYILQPEIHCILFQGKSLPFIFIWWVELYCRILFRFRTIGVGDLNTRCHAFLWFIEIFATSTIFVQMGVQLSWSEDITRTGFSSSNMFSNNTQFRCFFIDKNELVFELLLLQYSE